MEREILEKSGLSSNEAKVLLELAELDRATVSEISKSSKVHRTNVYTALKKLVDKGIVSYLEKDNSKYYEIRNLEKLYDIVDNKQKILGSIMPELMLDHQMASEKDEVHVFEGVKALRDVLNEWLELDKTILTFGIPKEVPEIFGDWLVPHHKRRIKMGINMLHIYNEDAKDRIKFLNMLPHTEAKYLPKEFNSPVTTHICENNVLLIMWKTSPIIVKITNKDIAESYERYFHLLWRIARK